MITEEQPYLPLLQRYRLREHRVRELWTSPPELEYIALSGWCRRAIEDNLHLLYDWIPDREAGWIQTPGIALARALDIEMPTSYSLEVGWGGEVYYHNSPTARILSITEEDRDRVLDIVDYLLSSELATASRVDELDSHLRDGSSSWRIIRDNSGLELRRTVEEEESFRQATSTEDQVTQYLREAWAAAWPRNSLNATVAYDSAIKALEAILIPIVIPNQSQPTLGKVIGALGAKDNQGKWDTRFRGVETVQALRGLLKELWKMHDRHAGMPPNTLEEAQDAVTIAVAVVALVRRGFIFPTGNP